MNARECVGALRRMKVQTGSLVCLGCGMEHSCGVHGCAILRRAAEIIEELGEENARLHRENFEQSLMK